MIISPLMSIPMLCLGLYYNRNEISRGYAVPFALLFGTLGYSLRPRTAIDLERYYLIIDRLNGQELLSIFAEDRDRLYIKDILFYFVSKTGNNNILAYIVGFFCYLIIFYVFFDVVIRYRDSSKPNCNIHIFMIGLVMVSIINPFSIIGNVRCVFAYILISFAAYRDWVQKKRNIFTLLLYILPVGLHVSAIVVLITRICVPVFRKFSKVFFVAAILLPPIIRLVYEFFSRMTVNSFIFLLVRNAVNKAYYYLNWTEGGWADIVEKSISNRVTRTYGSFFLVIIIIFYFALKRERDINKDEKMCDYLYIIAIISLGCLSIKTGAFWRFESIVVLFSPVILMPIAMNKVKYCRKLLHLLYLSACVMCILNIIIFTRNIIMDEFIMEYISTSTLKIIWEMLGGIMSLLKG